MGINLWDGSCVGFSASNCAIAQSPHRSIPLWHSVQCHLVPVRGSSPHIIHCEKNIVKNWRNIFYIR